MFQYYLLIAYRLIILQLLFLGIAAGIAVFTSTWHNTASVLLGGSAWIIPSLYFVRKLFQPKTARDSHALVRDFFLGEGVKLLFSIGLIALIIFFVPIKAASFIGGYIAVISASFFMPLLSVKKPKNDN